MALLLSSLPLACVPQGDASQGDAPAQASTAQVSDAPVSTAPTRLAVVWSSGDRDVALKVTFMYTLNAKSQGWFDEVTLIVWGPSSLLLSQDRELQEYVARMQEAGVEVVACQACADSYGVSDALRTLGAEVKYMGRPLTDMLQGEWEVITF